MGTLAERLGYGPDDRILALNGDDLGLHSAQNDATFEALLSGHLTSATLMVPCPAAEDAARRAAAEGIGLGVHLTLNAEWATYRWGPLTGDPSLCDADSCLPRTVMELYGLGAGVLPAVRRECRAQVEQAYEWGVDVTHLDSHMGANQLNVDYFEVYVDLAAEFDLPLRMGPAALEEAQGSPQRNAAAERGLLFCDDLVLGAGDAGVWSRVLADLRPGVTEVFLHTALATPAMGEVADDHAQRATDYWLATSPESPFAEAQRVSYAQVRDLQRSLRAS